jgi:hypothetical protein
MPGLAADGDAPAEEFSLAKLGIADADPCEGFVAKHDFDTWQWYNADGRKHPPPDTAALEDAAAFTFAGDKDEILKELMSEGVARIGTISETWLQACEAFCAGNEFDNVLTLGSARREDGYAAKGEPIAGPWKEWMKGIKHEYGYASIITAFPTPDFDQSWHRDTPDDKESDDHQITFMVYFTDVHRGNGATEFRRIFSRSTPAPPAPPAAPASATGAASPRAEPLDASQGRGLTSRPAWLRGRIRLQPHGAPRSGEP